MKTLDKKDITGLTIVLILCIWAACFAIKNNRKIEEIKLKGIYTIGKIVEIEPYKGRFLCHYEFTFNEVVYKDKAAYNGPYHAAGDKIFIAFLPNRPTANLPLFKTVVLPCILFEVYPQTAG